MITYNITTGCAELYINCKYHSALIKADETFYSANDLGNFIELTKTTVAGLSVLQG